MSALPPKVARYVPGLSWRRMDHWVRAGYLQPIAAGGSGHPRTWPDLEVRVAADMLRLVEAGLTPTRAHDVARTAQEEGVASIVLDPGVVLTYVPTVEPGRG